MLTVFLIKNGPDPYTFQFVPESVSVARVEIVNHVYSEDETLLSIVVPEVEGSTDGAGEEDMKSKPIEVDVASKDEEYLGPLKEVEEVSRLNTFTVQFDTESCVYKEDEKRKDNDVKDVEAGEVTNPEYIENTDVCVVVISDVLLTGFSPVSSSSSLDAMSLFFAVTSSCTALFSRRVGRNISLVIHDTITESVSELCKLWSSSIISLRENNTEALWSELWPPDRCFKFHIMIDDLMLTT